MSNKILNNKGVSTVIATVLIITLTLVAGGILSQFAIKFVKEKLKEGDCFPYRDYLIIDDSLGYSCFTTHPTTNPNKILYGVSIKGNKVEKTNQENVTGFIMILSNGSNVKRIEINSTIAQSLLSGGVRIWNETSQLKVPENGDIITFVYNATFIEKYDRVEVAPVLKNGRACGISSTARLATCRAGVTLG